jgi:hypothetical protein
MYSFLWLDSSMNAVIRGVGGEFFYETQFFTVGAK